MDALIGRARSWHQVAARACLALVLLLTIAATAFIRKSFGEVSWHQVHYHLQQGGLDVSDPELMRRAQRWAWATVGLAAVFVALLVRVAKPLQRAMWMLLAVGATVSVPATLGTDCASEAGAPDYLAEHYVAPSAQRFERPVSPPDILLVFVESLNDRLVRPNGENEAGASLAPRLAQWRAAHADFGELHNLEGAAWTMGGMFSALCGLPLQAIGLLDGNDYAYARGFFEGGRCLTDVLAASGYEIAFYGGASLRFAGKGKFLAAHGVVRRFGREEWAARGADIPSRGWGLLDTELTERALADMQRPRADSQPRMHIVLTVNSHGPDGVLDQDCALPAPAADAGPSATLRHAYQCSDRAVHELVQRFLAARDGRPKLAWVMGDHVAHGAMWQRHAAALVPGAAAPADTVFHAFTAVNAQGEQLLRRHAARRFTHVDVLPTLAEAAGLRWAPDAHRLGMGVSLLAPDQRSTLLERASLAEMNARTACTSALFARLWRGQPDPHPGSRPIDHAAQPIGLDRLASAGPQP